MSDACDRASECLSTSRPSCRLNSETGTVDDSRVAIATCTPARSYSKSYDYAGRTPVPGPRVRRGCASVRAHLAHVAPQRGEASRSTSISLGSKPARLRSKSSALSSCNSRASSSSSHDAQVTERFTNKQVAGDAFCVWAAMSGATQCRTRQRPVNDRILSRKDLSECPKRSTH
jgi:hypothetical protein